MISYGAGALIIIIASVGALLILTGSGVFTADTFTAAGIVVTAFGLYTAIYGAVLNFQLYYVLWGGISVGVGVAIFTSNVISPLIAAGAALIFIAGLGAYIIMRR
jgi:hypothetical protein